VTQPPGYDDPHRRFAAWLLAAADDDPPRDLAVHASLCRDCQLEIAAFDMLTAVDLGRAGMPPPRALSDRRRLATPGRVVAAVSGAAAMAAIGVGGWRLADAGGLGGGLASEAPTQAVLGNTGHPETPPASPSGSAPATTKEPDRSPSPSPSATTGSVPPPLPPTATQRPTPRPTPTPRPSIIVSSPTPVPTPRVTAAPSPTLEPTPEPTPDTSPSAAAEAA
jgi:hypothetical protein